jgi:Ca2+-binding EF-hand superfamily protein
LAELPAADLQGEEKVDFYAFVQAALLARAKLRAGFRENGGFSKKEVMDMRESFERYDEDDGGTIAGTELVNLIQNEFGGLARSTDSRPMLVQLLREADEDGTGELDFKAFLRVMRLIKDMQDGQRISKEHKAVAETKFTPSQVQDFRELFTKAAGNTQEVSFEALMDLLSCIVPMGTRNCEELWDMFLEVASCQTGTGDGCVHFGSEEMLDFPEFLWLMRELLNKDFAGITERANALAGEHGVS